MVDLAVAVVMGAAFTAIVNSMVDDIIMPIIGVLIGGIDFSGLALIIEETITYGNFLQAIVNFLLISLVIFFLVRAVNNLQKRLLKETEKPAEEAPPELTGEEKLLMEIRDLLKEQRG